MNPLYGMMNPMVQRFMQFQQTFKGDAQSQVQALLNSGRVTQAQYNNAVQIAQQIQAMLPPSAHR